VTNGTSAGTSEISVAGAGPGGLQPGELTVFGSEVLFAGVDANGQLNLWVTNGTSAGTSEISVAGASPAGLQPGSFAVFGSEVLFSGLGAADGGHNLWVTNGTSAGTSEISVAGAYSGGLQPGYFTPFAAVVDSDTIAEPPLLKAPSSLTVTAGGSKPLGIFLSAVDSDDTLSVSISGVPAFESVTAAGATPTVTKHGTTFTYTFNALPSADWNNGLILHSTFPGKGHPVNAFTVTASNSTSGEAGTSAAKTITVTDPPASVASGPHIHPLSLSDLMAQFGSRDATSGANPLNGGRVGSLTDTNVAILNLAALAEQFMGAPFVSGGASGLLPSSLTAEEQRGFLASHPG
jgi:hypothetical protein